MGRIFVAGLVIVMVGAFMVIGLASEAPNALAGVIPTDTPTPTASDTPTPSATATPTTTASASVSASASVDIGRAAGKATAMPPTGGNPSDGSPNLTLNLAIALGAVA